MTDVEGTQAFLSAASALAHRLSAADRVIFDLQYHGLSFGSWSTTAGTRKRRVRLNWDGRERLLLVETAVFGDSRSRPVWTPSDNQVVAAESTEQVFELAEQIILVESGAPPA